MRGHIFKKIYHSQKNFRCSANTVRDAGDSNSSEQQIEDFDCSICSKDFTMMSSLNRHIEIVHTAVDGGVECTKDFCEMVFNTRHEMYIHRDTCIFPCQVCGLDISRNGKVAGHTKKCNASKRMIKKIENFIIHLNQ